MIYTHKEGFSKICTVYFVLLILKTAPGPEKLLCFFFFLKTILFQENCKFSQSRKKYHRESPHTHCPVSFHGDFLHNYTTVSQLGN